jgi:hypothetical protein
MHRIAVALILGAASVAVVSAAAAAPKPPKPGKGSTLTIAAAPNPVTFRRVVTISGRLNGPNKSGQTVQLLADGYPYGGNAPVATAVTDANGDYAFSRRPPVNTRYQTKVANVTSTEITALVRPAVGLRLSDYTPRKRQRVRFRGRVCPAHNGSRVAIQRRFATGYRTIARATLAPVVGSSCSSYKRTLRPRRDGRFRTVIAAHADHARGVSRSRVVRVH